VTAITPRSRVLRELIHPELPGQGSTVFTDIKGQRSLKRNGEWSPAVNIYWHIYSFFPMEFPS